MAAPLAMPPDGEPAPATTTSLGTVSVVMMARAAAAPGLVARRLGVDDGGDAGSTVSIGKGMPIRPVWQIEDLLGRRADATGHERADASAAARPAPPVAAFALPDVRTTPAGPCPWRRPGGCG